jgi:hypothetical protein
MKVLDCSRQEAMAMLPKGGIGCEVGVLAGDFSKVLLEACEPRVLHLIDLWNYAVWVNPLPVSDLIRLWPYPDTTPHPQAVMDYLYESCRQLPGCAVHRGDSTLTAAAFRDETFDWAYIDGDHRFGKCLADIRAWSRNVKPDGVLAVHDYVSGFGVMEAVERFVSDSEWDLHAVTKEDYPTVFLRRTEGPP